MIFHCEISAGSDTIYRGHHDTDFRFLACKHLKFRAVLADAIGAIAISMIEEIAEGLKAAG